MADLPVSVALPAPETDDLGRYLEDTITIDWQTPAVSDCARRLLAGAPTAEAGVERLFCFVRDEITHSFDRGAAPAASLAAVSLAPAPSAAPTAPRVPATPATSTPSASSVASGGIAADFVRRGIACRASEVLALGHGLCFAKSHLLAALLRFAGHPTGFCYVKLIDEDRPGRFVLHGFNAVHWPPTVGWMLLDPRGNRGRPGEPGAITSECRFEAPFSLAFVPDPQRGESLLPFVYKRPAKRIVDFLERVPDEEALRRNLPDGLD